MVIKLATFFFYLMLQKQKNRKKSQSSIIFSVMLHVCSSMVPFFLFLKKALLLSPPSLLAMCFSSECFLLFPSLSFPLSLSLPSGKSTLSSKFTGWWWEIPVVNKPYWIQSQLWKPRDANFHQPRSQVIFLQLN